MWAAWGNIIDTRFYLGECLEEIERLTTDISWYACGKLTKQGNPRHTLYMKTDEKFDWFPVFDYLAAWSEY